MTKFEIDRAKRRILEARISIGSLLDSAVPGLDRDRLLKVWFDLDKLFSYIEEGPLKEVK